jgi:hypothetical protein
MYKQKKRKEQGHCCFEGKPNMYDMMTYDAQYGGVDNYSSGCMSNARPMPLPPRLVPMVSSDNRDLDGKIRGAPSRVNVTDDEGFMGNSVAVSDDQLFVSLYTAVGFNMNLADDPFEPTPMVEAKQEEKNWNRGGEAVPSLEFDEDSFLECSLIDRPSCNSTRHEKCSPGVGMLPTLFSQQDFYQIFDAARS